MALRTVDNYKSTNNARNTTNGIGAITGPVNNAMFLDTVDSAVFSENTGVSGDLDDLTKSGFYYVASAATNNPLGETGALLHFYKEGPVQAQMFISYESQRVLFRNKSTTWSSWQEVKRKIDTVYGYAVASSGTNTYTASMIPAGVGGTGYEDRNIVTIYFGTTNTGPSTLNINTVAAKAIKKTNAAGTLLALNPNDIQAGKVLSLLFSTGDDCFILMGADNGIRSVTISLSTADIASANSTPVTLVAAPGAGYVLQRCSDIIAITDYTSAVWATNTNGFVKLGTGGLALSDNFSNLLTNAADSIQITHPTVNSMQSLATYENKPIIFEINTGNPTGGGTNTMRISFSYRIITI